MTDRFTIRPGVARNRAEVIASLKARGFYDSGIPRAAVPKKKERAARPVRLTRTQLRYLSDDDFRKYMDGCKV